MSRGVSGAHRPRCLGPELSAYADRALVPDELRAWDRHLVACTGCRQAVESERRLLASLRAAGGPEVPVSLRSMLLSLGSATGQGAEPTSPSTPAPAPARYRPGAPSLPVVDRSAPAMHRSAVRATVLAGLAAGASAAAAWSFAVTAPPLTPAAPVPRTPGSAVQRSGSPTPSFANASFGSRSRPIAPVAALVLGSVGGPIASRAQPRSAQSTP
ncbi:MAG TPA: hypothetical protein VFN47_06130 [Pedococcus sp.]|nr:hypothetical protein [Pedococcus sp.]